MNAPIVNSDSQLSAAIFAADGLRLRMFTDMEAVKPIWVTLEATGVSTVYQSFVWCRMWLQRVGKARSISPIIVVAENMFGEAMFIVPLQMRRKYGLRIVEALTAPQGAYAFGVFNKAFLEKQAEQWFEKHFEDLVAILPRHDVLRLADTPAAISNIRNPLLVVRNFEAANLTHIMGLQSNYQALLEKKRSPESRRSMRKRDAKLQAAGKLVFDLPLSLEERKATVEMMLTHQKLRLAEAGVHGVFDAVEQQFIVDLIHTHTASGAFLRPYRLMLDGEIVAVMLGAYNQGTYWALISSIAPGPIQKYSPGDYALRSMIKHLCEDGTQVLDFSAGNTAYKGHWSDRQIPLYFIVRASTVCGMVAATVMLLRETIKRISKNTPIVNTLLFAMRRFAKGQNISS
jgi:CelD/BcsL family acetyltransferase involved in cellulose biosynthesis